MSKMILPLVAVILVLVVGTYWQGILSERWRPVDSEKLQSFTELLSNVPSVMGDWKGEDAPYDNVVAIGFASLRGNAP